MIRLFACEVQIHITTTTIIIIGQDEELRDD